MITVDKTKHYCDIKTVEKWLRKTMNCRSFDNVIKQISSLLQRDLVLFWPTLSQVANKEGLTKDILEVQTETHDAQSTEFSAPTTLFHLSCKFCLIIEESYWPVHSTTQN